MKLEATSEWLRADTTGRPVGVDREANALRGYVVAQEGAFKDGRGMFDLKSLKQIAAGINSANKGLKSRFSHPSLSADGLGKYLGRAKTGRVDVVKLKRNGEPVLLHAVRADLHFDATALKEPPGGGKPLGEYVMDLAESDPDAISSSLVLQADQEQQLDPKTKKPMLGEDGQPLPPLWRVRKLHATDIVDEGAAVDGILSSQLSIEGLPDHVVRMASQLLDEQFGDAEPDVIRARAHAWLERYLAHRFNLSPKETEAAAKCYAHEHRLRKLKLVEVA